MYSLILLDMVCILSTCVASHEIKKIIYKNCSPRTRLKTFGSIYLKKNL